MVDRSRTRNAKIRASFGRAERLRRNGQDGRSADRDNSERKPERERTAQTRKREAAQARATRKDGQQRDARKATSREQARARTERADERTAKRRMDRLKEQTRAGFTKTVERRRDEARRAQHERKQRDTQAALKRAQDQRQRADRQRDTRKREETRRDFNREADRRRDHTRRREVEFKAGVEAQRERDLRRAAGKEIEQRHKRQLSDQQAEHRRQTSQIRSRHQAETRSLRSNEDMALERHHHAVKGIDERERRTLADFDGRRAGLTGWLGERIPGRRQENDRLRADLARGFEAERLTKHRDLEALKERQFNVAQTARLEQAKERKDMMTGHHADRTKLQDRQMTDRPLQIERQARVMERVRDMEVTRKEPERERERPAPAFSKT
ncbi:hypothetical protein [Lichenifustis flavocetrariae]|uniref:Uncharacterized protein n=1 Tax=Lichenifustis flavocetrariae TaxID=2949735 RepID=A0AA41Z155_9HYPH|nr:hypothetical protein [Lichenifustis flavocetrariae]MCW6512306.1 hypothetical protein [Lichenifustis flavocetrariae]